MRGPIRAALVVLSAVGVVLGIAPAAQAADMSIGWSTAGGVYTPGWEPTVCSFNRTLESGQTLLVQVLEGDTWVARRTYTDPRWNQCFTIDPTALVPGPGTYTFRALSRVPSTGQLATSEQVTFTLRQDDGQVYWLDSGDFEATNDWMGSGLRLSTKSPKNTALRIPRAHGQVVELQRKAASKWVTVSRTQAPAEGTDVTVRVKIPPRAGLSTHRFVSRATAWNPTVVTGSFRVYQSAVVNKTSYIAEARSYMARYCPKTPIRIDTSAVAARTGGSRVGQAPVSWGSSGGKNVLITRIELRSGMSPDMLRAVALHECGHVVQFRSMVKGRFNDVVRQAEKLWPGTGIEGQADCMSYQVTRDPMWMGYVPSCSKAQLVNAARMWQTYGGKYQAATYRW